jgi:c-di-GMP-binding flagellar brake protein YcgR
MDDYNGPERRKALRVKAEFIVIYRVESPPEIHMWIGNREIHAVMVDLSEIGMAICTDYDIPGETILAIKFTLINLHAERDDRVRVIELTGKVRYSIFLKDNEYRLGIAFMQVSEVNKHAISRFAKTAMKK